MRAGLFFGLCLILFAYGCVHSNDSIDLSNIPQEKLCVKDSDCVTIQNSCCKHTLEAINLNYKENTSRELDKSCEHVECLLGEYPDVHISVFSSLKCINRTCVLIPNKQEVCNSNLLKSCHGSMRLSRRAKDPSVIGDERDQELLKMEIEGYGVPCEQVLDLCKTETS